MCIDCDIEEFEKVGLRVWIEEDFTLDGIYYENPYYYYSNDDRQIVRPLMQLIDDWELDAFYPGEVAWGSSTSHMNLSNQKPFCDLCYTRQGATSCLDLCKLPEKNL